jgi:hypothetical protein
MAINKAKVKARSTREIVEDLETLSSIIANDEFILPLSEKILAAEKAEAQPDREVVEKAERIIRTTQERLGMNKELIQALHEELAARRPN